MGPIIANIVVLAVIAVVVGLAVRSMWKKHKNGGGCSCDCGNCKGCH